MGGVGVGTTIERSDDGQSVFFFFDRPVNFYTVCNCSES